MRNDSERELRLEWVTAAEAVREAMPRIRAGALDEDALQAVDCALRARLRWLRATGRIDSPALFRHPE